MWHGSQKQRVARGPVRKCRCGLLHHPCLGAGLYDSVPLVPLREQTLDYTQAPVVWDWQFQQDLLKNIANVGVNVEEAFGGVPQDIEGVYSNEALTIVQSRPQVL